MISEAMQEALNKQINEELFSAYVYASMAAHFEHANLKGFANWMRMQSDEELEHARKFVNYLLDRGARVKYTAIGQPKNEWDSPLAAVQDALDHERHISECINNLSTQSQQEKDHATHAFLEWFVTEQVEEEANVDEIVQQLKLVEGAPGGLFLLDRELNQRQPDSGAAEQA